MHIPGRPNGKFDPECPVWQQWMFEEASNHDSTVKDIAALAGVPYTKFKHFINVNYVISAGRAVYRRNAAAKMSYYMFVDIDLIDDPMEKSQLRGLQLDALKHWSKLEQKREELEALRDDKEKDRDAISSMTLEQLKDRARQLIQ